VLSNARSHRKRAAAYYTDLAVDAGIFYAYTLCYKLPSIKNIVIQRQHPNNKQSEFTNDTKDEY